jgi:O-antigen ligase
LWRLSVQLIGERPFLGIGLDNFRLAYGRLLNADSWNETIHTNNWYLEFLVGGGLLAALPFFAWLAGEGLLAWRVMRQPPVDPWLLAIFAGMLAFLIHGLLDFFLLFNSTGLLFWLLVGLWWQWLKENKNPQIDNHGSRQITQISFPLSLRLRASVLSNSKES